MPGNRGIRIWELPSGRKKRHDFNRLRYSGVPSSEALKQSTPIRSVNFMRQCLTAFDQMTGSKASWSANFTELATYLRFCDQVAHEPFEEASVFSYSQHLKSRQQREEILDSVYDRSISALKTTLTAISVRYSDYFRFIERMGKSQLQNHEAYSARELTLLISSLYDIFSQLFIAFKQDPGKFCGTGWESLATTSINEKKVIVPGAMSRFLSCGVYLIAFFSGLNTSILLNIPRELKTKNIGGELFLEYTEVKPRGRYTEVSTSIPKDSQSWLGQIFKCLAEVSETAYPNNKWLFAFPGNNGGRLQSVHLSSFNKWFREKINLKADDGSSLLPLVSRFRVSNSIEEAINYGPRSAANLLDNSVTQISKSYSRISAFESEQRLANSFLRLYESVKQPYDTKVTPQTNAKKAEIPELSLTSIFQCFGCEHQALVNDPYFAWLYLSLLRQLECQKLTPKLQSISTMARQNLTNLSDDIREQGNQLLNKFGCHPLWADSSLQRISALC